MTESHDPRQRAIQQATLLTIMEDFSERQKNMRRALLLAIDNAGPKITTTSERYNLHELYQSNHTAVFDALSALRPKAHPEQIFKTARETIYVAYEAAKDEILGEFPAPVHRFGDVKDLFKQASTILKQRWKFAGTDDAGCRLPFNATLRNFMHNLNVGPESPSYLESPMIHARAQKKIAHMLELIGHAPTIPG